jgi:hypothetical protein
MTPLASGSNEREPDRVFADRIGANKAERRSGTGEVRFAAAKNKRTKVEMILVDETEVSKTRRQIGSGNVDDAVDLRLQPANEGFEIVSDKRGVGADRP